MNVETRSKFNHKKRRGREVTKMDLVGVSQFRVGDKGILDTLDQPDFVDKDLEVSHQTLCNCSEFKPCRASVWSRNPPGHGETRTTHCPLGLMSPENHDPHVTVVFTVQTDPEDGVSYASVSFTRTNRKVQLQKKHDEDDDDDDDDDAVTYSSVKVSSFSASCDGASTDPNIIYTIINQPNK
ncbi:hypothetical protein Q5P01_004664 [Channa striata]|uniref:Uncharacterized protein n=1 Tax=Channa striata TaxID=64152 RepID=A0AA88NBL8_CHASR|nr:hypothetical protein Q5P01_004664 [Channa striata]